MFTRSNCPLHGVARSALSDICKHSPELAQTVVDAGAGLRSEVMGKDGVGNGAFQT